MKSRRKIGYRGKLAITRVSTGVISSRNSDENYGIVRNMVLSSKDEILSATVIITEGEGDDAVESTSGG